MEKAEVIRVLGGMLIASIAFTSSQRLLGNIEVQDSLEELYQLEIQRTDEKIRLDGKLDEAIWSQAQAATDFWMSFPVDDRRVSSDLQTEVRLTYDDHFIYVGAICHGPNDYIISTLKRDAREFWTGDVFSVLIDPVNEASNGFNFSTSPAGVQYESLISGRTGTRAEMNSGGSISGFNSAWDNRWYVEINQELDRWTVEMAIPFKTLRFDPEKTTWGVNFIRGEPRSNSWHTWSPVPVQFLTVDLGYTGTIEWDRSPTKNKSNISLIPYTRWGLRLRTLKRAHRETLNLEPVQMPKLPLPPV